MVAQEKGLDAYLSESEPPRVFAGAKTHYYVFESEGQARGLIGTDEEGNLKPLFTLDEQTARELFKQEREKAVAAIVVEVDGLLFDGDEVAQGRMARAALVMHDEETTLWVLANNEPAQVTKAQLVEVLRLAGAEQTRLWVMP